MRRCTNMVGHSADEGYSLVELVIVMSLLSVVIGLAFMLFNSTESMSDRVQTRSILKEQVRSAVDQMTRELRQADEISSGAGAFNTLQPRNCIFYADIQHTGVPQRVNYYMTGSKLLRATASSTTSVPPYVYGADSAPTTVVSTISASYAGPLFTYYDVNGTVLNSTQGYLCSAVSIRLVGESKVPSSRTESVTVDLSTWVRIRSVLNGL